MPFDFDSANIWLPEPPKCVVMEALREAFGRRPDGSDLEWFAQCCEDEMDFDDKTDKDARWAERIRKQRMESWIGD